jgi:hypothetical protein
MEDAYKENLSIEKPRLSDCPPYAIFSQKYCNEINELDHTKKYDYCFIGSINSAYQERLWVIDFVKAHFNKNSFYINTDINDTNKDDYVTLGEFDHSKKGLGFKPKSHSNNQSRKAQFRVVSENVTYFQTMCQSKYILCPAGDAPWSFRFYETIICKSVPLVINWHHTYRTKEEAAIKYKYILRNEILNDDTYKEYVDTNTEILKTFHMLKPS